MRSRGSANLAVVILVGLLLALVAYFLWKVGSYYFQIKRGEAVVLPRFSMPGTVAPSGDSAQVYDLATTDDPSFGPVPEQARVTVVEFVDYQCPYCQEAAPIVRSLMLKYQDQVRFVIRDFPLPSLHDRAFDAAEAAGCAEEQGKFWPMHDWLYANQDKLTRPAFDQAARSLGLDQTTFDACLDSHRRLAEIRQDQADGNRAGVVGTPTFFLDGHRLEGVIPSETFEKLIAAELAR